jgi:cytochrome c oxidase subunit 4
MGGHNDNHEEHHVPNYADNIVVYLALLALTALTVSVAGIDLGSYTFFVAMLVASIKALLVINIFMHIKFDDWVFKGILISCGFIVLVVFVFLGFDILFRG